MLDLPWILMHLLALRWFGECKGHRIGSVRCIHFGPLAAEFVFGLIKCVSSPSLDIQLL